MQMGDPYWRYGAPADTGNIPRSTFPGYLASEASTLTSHQPWNSNDLILPSRRGPYGVDDIVGIDVHPKPGIGGLTAGASIKGYPSALEDPSLLSQRRDITFGLNPSIPEIINERPDSLRKADGSSVIGGESNILFVDGLPTDCLRREVGHLFRPFIGFREIRVVHKEPRSSGDKAMVLCFVEFTDAKCALTALEALQGYKFDDKKPDSPVLRIHFAHFPFRLPSERDEQRFVGLP